MNLNDLERELDYRDPQSTWPDRIVLALAAGLVVALVWPCGFFGEGEIMEKRQHKVHIDVDDDLVELGGLLDEVKRLKRERDALDEAIKVIGIKYRDLHTKNVKLHFQLQEEQKARASAEEAAMFLFNETNCDYLEAEERWPWLMVVYGCGERDCNERDADPE